MENIVAQMLRANGHKLFFFSRSDRDNAENRMEIDFLIRKRNVSRNIDKELIAWKDDSMRKPLLLRGARQVGKSSAVRHFGKGFKYFAEVYFERHKAIKTFFQGDIDVRMIAQKISSYIKIPMVAGETLLFFDEIQECPEAIMALRFFKEDYPELHVIAAGSLLEFTLEELPTFGVGKKALIQYHFQRLQKFTNQRSHPIAHPCWHRNTSGCHIRQWHTA